MVALRSALYFVYFAVVSIVLNLLWLPALVGPRSWAMAAARIWSGAALWGLRVIAGTTYEVRGRENMPRTPSLVASKHMSMWDTLALTVLLRDPVFVLKRELRWIPFYGWYNWKAGTIAVDRGAHASALRRLIADGKYWIAKGRSIAIFPEGTRKHPGAPTDYKAGVAALYTMLDVPCIPVALNSGLYWPRRGFRRNPGTIVIEFLAPIPTGLKRPQFMDRLQSDIESATARLLAEARSR